MGQSAKFTPRKLNTLNQNNKALKKIIDGPASVKNTDSSFSENQLDRPLDKQAQILLPYL
jgi:hypothetical protein